MRSVSGGQKRNWQRHFFYRKESIKSTWKLRFIVLCGVVLILYATRSFWIAGIGQSLVCNEEPVVADAVLVENLDVSYRAFERAATFQRAGFRGRILIPVQVSSDPDGPNLMSEKIVGVLTGVAGLQRYEIIPIQIAEPISLNAAFQIREFLMKENIRSVVVVTPGFRSRRSALIYQAVLGGSGIGVSCVPVFGEQNTRNWGKTWHGIQDVAAQFLKLLYYRLYVLPFVFSRHIPTGR